MPKSGPNFIPRKEEMAQSGLKNDIYPESLHLKEIERDIKT